MSTYKLSDVTALNGNPVVQINNSDSVLGAVPGSMVQIGTEQIVFLDSVDIENSQITLTSPWPYADAVNTECTIAPITAVSSLLAISSKVNEIVEKSLLLSSRLSIFIYPSISEAIVEAESGNLSSGMSILTLGFYSGTFVGGNIFVLKNAAAPSSRPAERVGRYYHVGNTNDYFSAVFPGQVANLEQFGAIGDYNPATQIGTDNSPAIAALRNSGLQIKVQLQKNTKYKITEAINLYSGMNWEGDFTCEFHPQFPTSGIKMFESPDDVHKDVSIVGVTLYRIGQHAEHGGVVDAIENGNFYLRIISDGSAPGGAFGVSAFYPSNRPSKNVTSIVEVEYGGNFALQYGNVSGGSMEVISSNTHREVLGLEPYALGKVDVNVITDSAISYPSHGMKTADPVMYSAQGNAVIPGLKNGETYFAIIIDDNTIKLASSSELAWDGQALTLGALTGVQRLYRAGLLENIQVKGVRNKTEDVPSAGSSTGVIIITATSGGFHRNIVINDINSELNNPSSGTHNVNIFGAKNVCIDNCNLLGGQSGIRVNRGFLQGVKDISGNIDPTPALALMPDVVIRNSLVLGSSSRAIDVLYGKAIVENCVTKSERPGVTGIYISPEAQANGSYAKNNTADIPNGTAFDFIEGFNNIDLNHDVITNIYMRRIADTRQYITVNLANTLNVVATLHDVNGAQSNYSGQVHITAKPVDAGNTETTSYILNVVKKSAVHDGEVSIVNQLGLTEGGGVSHPSFTWSIDSNNALLATPVGQTEPNRDWHFWCSVTGDLILK